MGTAGGTATGRAEFPLSAVPEGVKAADFVQRVCRPIAAPQSRDPARPSAPEPARPVAKILIALKNGLERRHFAEKPRFVAEYGKNLLACVPEDAGQAYSGFRLRHRQADRRLARKAGR